jgi:5-methylcytosine-specific restriction endonuclease McrA
MAVEPRSRSRSPISKSVQVNVFERDHWLCRWCLKPVIFPPALRLLQQLVEKQAGQRPIAYFHPNWRRDAAPLLDELGASVDHIEAHVRGGPDTIENFATICARCNARKGSRTAKEHLDAYPLRKIRSKYGEPVHWDGLASVFLALAEGDSKLSPAELEWQAALKNVRMRYSKTS